MEPMSNSCRTRVARLGAVAVLLGLGLSGCGSSSQTASQTRATTPQTSAKFAQTVLLEPISGKVLVKVPATAGGATSAFGKLSSARTVPVGTVVDATAGHVRLTVATAVPGQLKTGEFHGGIFEITQTSADRGLAVLTIHDNLPRSTSCPRTHGRLSDKILGLLRGTASGGFETAGKYSAATVRGTEYGVRDRCDGTYTVVQEGEVLVVVFHSKKNVVLRTGQTFLASAG